MEGPGLSIFKSSDLQFSNSFQRAEEEEFAEENRKREAELKDLFQDAFDDLNDDDDDASSLASSQFSANQSDHEFKALTNFNFAPPNKHFQELPIMHQPIRKEANLETIHEKHNESNDSIAGQNHERSMASRVESDISGQHYKHCFKKSVKNDGEKNLIENYKRTESDSYDELKVLYEVRMREVERLRREVDIEKEAKEEAIHQLALCQTEKKKSLTEIKNLDDLISKSKDRISELEESVDKMKLEILSLEKAREKDEEEVKISHEQVHCLEQKIAAMERCDPSVNRMKQMDTFIENLNSKHQKEITILQNKIDSITSKYEQKESECKGLESKLDEVERKRAALVLEKCDGAARQENALQSLLLKSNEEKVELNRQIVSLQSECAGLKSELEQYESVAKLRLCLGSSSDDSSELGHTGTQIARTRSASSIVKTSQVNPHHQDLINNLRDELHRALLGKAAKRHEINKLQEQVRSKELQIQEMKERERVYLSQADSLKADITKIVGQLSEGKNNDQSEALEKMKTELDRLALMNQEHLFTINKLNLEIERLQKDMICSGDLNQRTVGLRENELAQLKSQAEELVKAKDMEWRCRLEVVVKECDEIKQLYMNLRKNNGRLSDQLESQKQQLSLLTSEKEHILSLLKEKEMLIDNLKEENIKFKVEKELNRVNNFETNTQDKNVIILLEQEIEKLQKELVELPKKQTKELEILKSELEAAKFRLIELDNRLRNEFQNEISALINERDQLKDVIKNNNIVKSSCAGVICNDVGVGTELLSNYGDLNNEKQQFQNTFLPCSNELCEKKLTAELEELEKRLVSEHVLEMNSTEERIKSIMVTYYTNHIEEIKKHFEDELTKIIEKEQKKITELVELLSKKESEIQHLKNNDITEKLISLQKKIDEDRSKYSDSVKHWSNQVEQLKNKISEDENKIKYLNQSLKTERRDVQKYKAKFDNAKKRIQQEKLENMLKIKLDLDDFKSSNDLDCKRINDKIKIIELEFSDKEKLLKEKYESNKENLK